MRRLLRFPYSQVCGGPSGGGRVAACQVRRLRWPPPQSAGRAPSCLVLFGLSPLLGPRKWCIGSRAWLSRILRLCIAHRARRREPLCFCRGRKGIPPSPPICGWGGRSALFWRLSMVVAGGPPSTTPPPLSLCHHLVWIRPSRLSFPCQSFAVWKASSSPSITIRPGNIPNIPHSCPSVVSQGLRAAAALSQLVSPAFLRPKLSSGSFCPWVRPWGAARTWPGGGLGVPLQA